MKQYQKHCEKMVVDREKKDTEWSKDYRKRKQNSSMLSKEQSGVKRISLLQKDDLETCKDFTLFSVIYISN